MPPGQGTAGAKAGMRQDVGLLGSGRKPTGSADTKGPKVVGALNARPRNWSEATVGPVHKGSGREGHCPLMAIPLWEERPGSHCREPTWA